MHHYFVPGIPCIFSPVQPDVKKKNISRQFVGMIIFQTALSFLAFIKELLLTSEIPKSNIGNVSTIYVNFGFCARVTGDQHFPHVVMSWIQSHNFKEQNHVIIYQNWQLIYHFDPMSCIKCGVYCGGYCTEYSELNEKLWPSLQLVDRMVR